MTTMKKDAVREIIENFHDEIKKSARKTAKPSLAVINFRDELQAGTEREVVKVPVTLLRYRKENGRISSDVMDYEKNKRSLDEKDDASQAVIRKFLADKDPEKTAELRASMLQYGQIDPAIITCDGFLINGNRRKMVMEKLLDKHPNDERFKYMKVVILPGPDDEGGPPTLKEIETIENRYQLQSSGKSEYYGFDRALSIVRKIEVGLSLEEQLRDDPNNAEKSDAEIKKVIKVYTKKYVRPLRCVNRYLDTLGREGQYKNISTGGTDREGRWQAFHDYSITYYDTFKKPNRMIECNIEEDDVGDLEAAAFNIIRLRKIPDMPKVHEIMRKLPKYCRDNDGKKELLKLGRDVDLKLPHDEQFDEEGNELNPPEIDDKWVANNKNKIAYHVNKAAHYSAELTKKETPIELMRAALKKLMHENMKLDEINVADYSIARNLAVDIKNRAKEIEQTMYDFKKNFKKLRKKK